jgi:hypothetical protein
MKQCYREIGPGIQSEVLPGTRLIQTAGGHKTSHLQRKAKNKTGR